MLLVLALLASTWLRHAVVSPTVHGAAIAASADLAAALASAGADAAGVAGARDRLDDVPICHRDAASGNGLPTDGPAGSPPHCYLCVIVLATTLGGIVFTVLAAPQDQSSVAFADAPSVTRRLVPAPGGLGSRAPPALG